MIKKKQVPRNNIAFFTIIIIILLGFGIFLSINRITESESVPTLQVTIEPSPTFELFAGEEVVYISESLLTLIDNDPNYGIGGGATFQREIIDALGVTRTTMTMYLTTILTNTGEELIAYEGLEWDFGKYHIRVLAINPIGLAVLAVSENQ